MPNVTLRNRMMGGLGGFMTMAMCWAMSSCAIIAPR